MLDLDQYSTAVKILSLKATGQVGPRTFEALMTHFQTVDNILLAEEEDLLDVPGIGPEKSKLIFEADFHLEPSQRTIEQLEASDTNVVSCLDDDYPTCLYELNDPPLLLFFKGHLPHPDEKRVAVIGSQDVSAEGIGDAVKLAKWLAGKGISIVGGLSRGIDTAGHVGALKIGRPTYAMLPCGFNKIYPPENESLAKEITHGGGLLSEYLPDTPVNAGRLLGRNRLIVGMSQVIVVGEVSANSVGTLDTALCCHQLGKIFFVVVGDNNPQLDKLVEGGAIPLTSMDEYELIVKALV